MEARSPSSQIIIVHDDIDHPVGRIRIKRGGGDGGHEGVRSVAQAIGKNNFYRVRMGVGRGAKKVTREEYLTQPFEDDDVDLVTSMLIRAVLAIEHLAKHGIRSTAKEFHRPGPILSDVPAVVKKKVNLTQVSGPGSLLQRPAIPRSSITAAKAAPLPTNKEKMQAMAEYYRKQEEMYEDEMEDYYNRNGILLRRRCNAPISER
jgi:hypothetical protein